MTVLGIDPGIAQTGIAVIHNSQVAACGVIESKFKNKGDIIGDLDERAEHITSEVLAIVERYKPQAVVIEAFIFQGKNRQFPSNFKTSYLVGYLVSSIRALHQGVSIIIQDNKVIHNTQLDILISRLENSERLLEQKGDHALDAARHAVYHLSTNRS
ncbi:MAG: crossover junction endodeoxyribonuclease RuvC [Coriobacteriia bacterium]|nr:crossover junction endodeoxyribonuclease RuvC [Coriobacteriia bacterium]